MLGSAAGGGSVLGGVGVSLGGVVMETDGGAGSRAFPGTGLRAPSLSIPRTLEVIRTKNGIWENRAEMSTKIVRPMWELDRQG